MYILILLCINKKRGVGIVSQRAKMLVAMPTSQFRAMLQALAYGSKPVSLGNNESYRKNRKSRLALFITDGVK